MEDLLSGRRALCRNGSGIYPDPFGESIRAVDFLSWNELLRVLNGSGYHCQFNAMAPGDAVHIVGVRIRVRTRIDRLVRTAVTTTGLLIT